MVTRKTKRRGAVFVESLIVISMFTLGFIALVFLRDFYVKELAAMRLARAGVLSYAMTACDENRDNDPGTWIGQRDRGNFQLGSPGHERQNASDSNTSRSVSGSDQQSSDILSEVGGTSSDGKGILNPITQADVSGNTRVQARQGGAVTSSRKTMFEATARSRSFASCSDRVRDGDFKDLLHYVKGFWQKAKKREP
jgi:hypothetical protein